MIATPTILAVIVLKVSCMEALSKIARQMSDYCFMKVNKTEVQIVIINKTENI